jgi:DNA-binding PadR family transcriptional regulator
MQTIEERSDGNWRPSPGSVYPTLAQLEDEGLVRSVESEGQRRFELTDAGREHLETRAEEPAPWDIPEDSGHPGRDTKRLIAGVAQAAMQVAIAGDDAQKAQAIELLNETQRGLYGILATDSQE